MYEILRNPIYPPPPPGNQDSQFHSSITTAKLGARTLDTNPFGRYHAKLYLNTHINPKIYFPFTCSSLSNQQYIDINKEHIPSALSSMGFNRTWSLSLRYGCQSYGGLQLKHPQVEALIKNINTIQSVLSKPDTAPVFHIVLSWFQLVAGISTPILGNPLFLLNCVNSVFLKDLLRILKKIQYTTKNETSL